MIQELGAAWWYGQVPCLPGTSTTLPCLEETAGKQLTLWYWIDFSWKEGSVLTQKKCRNNSVGVGGFFVFVFVFLNNYSFFSSHLCHLQLMGGGTMLDVGNHLGLGPVLHLQCTKQGRTSVPSGVLFTDPGF